MNERTNQPTNRSIINCEWLIFYCDVLYTDGSWSNSVTIWLNLTSMTWSPTLTLTAVDGSTLTVGQAYTYSMFHTDHYC